MGNHSTRPSTRGISLVVLGADTTVTLDNHILGKPEDPADAARMLRLLSGRTHRVITGVAVVTAERTEVAAEVTAVQFLTLSDEEIAAYIATGEPMDKAGAYAIQGRAARWIPRIEGDYFNVVGLPIALRFRPARSPLTAFAVSCFPLLPSRKNHPRTPICYERRMNKQITFPTPHPIAPTPSARHLDALSETG